MKRGTLALNTCLSDYQERKVADFKKRHTGNQDQHRDPLKSFDPMDPADSVLFLHPILFITIETVVVFTIEEITITLKSSTGHAVLYSRAEIRPVVCRSFTHDD